ncbi:bem46 protein [Vibrio sp. JCM 19236]|nr:bem46 protein [Vibrio sp. JCM 19236]
MGRSLGSGIATYVAANEDIDTLILVTPFDSVENVAREIYWMFPVSLLIKDRYASIDRVKDISAQTHVSLPSMTG